jgi:DNA primase
MPQPERPSTEASLLAWAIPGRSRCWATPLRHKLDQRYGWRIRCHHRSGHQCKGGLFAWDSVRFFSTVILVEGLFDLAVLWQAGFRNTTCGIGTHLTPPQLAQLSEEPGRQICIVFDQDENQAGQLAAHQLARHLVGTGVSVRAVQLAAGYDPNSYFVAGATAADFTECLRRAPRL